MKIREGKKEIGNLISFSYLIFNLGFSTLKLDMTVVDLDFGVVLFILFWAFFVALCFSLEVFSFGDRESLGVYPFWRITPWGITNQWIIDTRTQRTALWLLQNENEMASILSFGIDWCYTCVALRIRWFF